MIRRILLFFLLISTFYSCTTLQKVKTGDEAFKQNKYMLAVSLYKKELNKADSEMEKARISTQIGHCFEYSNQTLLAEEWYSKALDLNADDYVLLNYGKMLKANEKYDQAIDALDNYKKYYPGDNPSTNVLIQGIRLAKKWKEENVYFESFNVESLNTPSADFGLTPFGNTYVFTSSRSTSLGEENDLWTGDKYFDLYLTERTNPTNFSGITGFSERINFDYHDGSVCFNSDYTEMFFTRCGSTDKSGLDACRIYYSKKDGPEWTDPVELDLFADSINVGQPWLASDDFTLFFTAKEPDGFGGSDIYVSQRQGAGWTEPINLGRQINTEWDEAFPFFENDTLYFSSNGHLGMGGLDIFSTTRLSNSWTKPTNLEWPINSAADDFGLRWTDVPVGKKDKVRRAAYVSSSRKGGAGLDDIWYIELHHPPPPPVPPVVFLLEGKVYEYVYADPNDPNSGIADTSLLAGAEVNLKEQDSLTENETVLITDGFGQVDSKLDSAISYSITVSKAGYFNKLLEISTDVEVEPGDTVWIRFDAILEPLIENVDIDIPNIYYDLGKWAIREDAAPILENLATLLKENPTLMIELGSHTDSRDTKENNQVLSQRRAQSAVNFLVSRGVRAERLYAKGYGELKLVNECADGVDCSEEAHQANRRTTFKILTDRFDITQIGQDPSIRIGIDRTEELIESLEERIEGIDTKDLLRRSEGPGSLIEEEPELVRPN